jgi:hypothetical protein
MILKQDRIVVISDDERLVGDSFVAAVVFDMKIQIPHSSSDLPVRFITGITIYGICDFPFLLFTTQPSYLYGIKVC